MAPATPKQAKREARPGSRFMAAVLADNLRRYRGFTRLSQTDLAERMESLGHRWLRQTVGQIEAGRRSVSVDELLGLAVSLQTAVSGLLSPMGPAWQPEVDHVDLGLPELTSAREAESIIRTGTSPDEAEPAFAHWRWAWDGNAPQPERTDVILQNVDWDLQLALRRRRREVLLERIEEIDSDIEQARQQIEGSLGERSNE